MTQSILALFPGQGSQKLGMGKALYEGTELAKDLFARADRVLGFSLSSICFEGPEERLTGTEIAQPAILTTSIIAFQLAFASKPLNIVAAAGHSLGEYSALVAGGSLSFDDAVLLVHKRGRYMQEAVPRGKGKMVAVLGKEVTDVESAIEKVAEGVVEIANINAPGQIVVAGSVEGVDAFVKALGSGRVVDLPVSAPFHCSLMKPAADSLARDLDAISFQKPAFPIYANVRATPQVDPTAIREALKDQVCGRVRWVECITNACSDTTPSIALEFGEGSILSGLLKRINPGLARGQVGTPAEIAAL